MSSAQGGGEDSRVGEDTEVVIDAERGDITLFLDRTHTLLAGVRAAHRAPPPPPADDDPRHEVFEREVGTLLNLTRQVFSEDSLLTIRDELLDRINTSDDLEPLFDEMIDSVMTARTADACARARFQIRLLAAVLSVYRPDIYTSGALEIGRHFYERAERELVIEGAITDHELQRAL